MPRLMYDSVTARDIPSTAKMVAGYVDGAYAWTAADYARFPNAVKVEITVAGNVDHGHVLDVETGDATPQQAAQWVKARRAKYNREPTVYCNASTWPAVRAAMRSAGVPDPLYWIASWDGQNAEIGGAIAHQYANPTLSGGHFDLSWVADYWEGVDPPPIPPPGPPPPAPPPPPPAPPPGPPAPPLDQARAAWARLGELLITDFPGAVAAVEAAIAKIQKLP